jgi:hypothetical protein
MIRLRKSIGTTPEEIADFRAWQARRLRQVFREQLDELNGDGKWLLSMAITVLDKPRVTGELLHVGTVAARADQYVRGLRCG